ncbi:hypothetical protein CVIRNUC_004866 [Coccomyxa viridis]|uniref:Uncharacterized protein n=1 Tax=Coccomyxa viridis TaxID=1274662 RepID=A0AAV1I3I2_9CHLO|nr:hypothetical protein CVIRNUC_004866 [Coccomyxa viridis]
MEIISLASILVLRDCTRVCKDGCPANLWCKLMAEIRKQIKLDRIHGVCSNVQNAHVGVVPIRLPAKPFPGGMKPGNRSSTGRSPPKRATATVPSRSSLGAIDHPLS